MFLFFEKSVVGFGFCLMIPAGAKINHFGGVILVKLPDLISENNAFSIEYSEAMVRDFDVNPCACES